MNIHENDPLELIRQADPAPRDSMPTAMSPLGRSIRARVAEEMLAERQPDHRRLVVRVVIALVVAALATAATWIITRDASDPSGVVCYEEASLQSTGIVVAAAPLDASLCASLWAEGALQNPAVERGAAPQLVACVNAHGVLVVFPASDNSDVCRDLNLARHQSSTSEQLLVDMNSRLNRLFADAPCLELDDAKLKATEIVRATGLEDWTVAVPTSATEERPCASYGIDAGSETVVLVPVPDRR
ncbi:MAG: hypothetical protein OXN44_11200 [Acidimicrobiaceae bacterium]|nr:hypothetical protein [Acidimicrobiaceae bacterium]MDE0607369.1 hypothetical protein [Acidimicrobiaceae bacterium]